MSEMTWQDVTVKIGTLKPWGGNPKTSTKKDARALLKSWDELGQFQTIAIGPDGDVYDGHQRLSALLTVYGANYEIAARVSSRNLTDEERRKIAIYSRQIGAWNWDILSGWSGPELREWGFDGDLLKDWKRDTAALDNFLKSEEAETVDAEPQIDRAAELTEKWGACTGDLWQIGPHRLLCGDSTKREDVERAMGRERAEMCFTDPPYRMEAEGGSNQPVGKAARKLGETIKDLVDFQPSDFLEILPESFETGRMNAYIFCNKDLVPDYLNWALSKRYSFNILFWKKPAAIPLGGSHRPDVEYLLLFRKNAIWNNNLSGVNYSKCLAYGRDDGEDHPTIKPMELVVNEMQISSNLGGIIYDPFAGSGTTIVACQNLSRVCRAIEISESYCAVILERMSQAFPELEIKRIA